MSYGQQKFLSIETTSPSSLTCSRVLLEFGTSPNSFATNPESSEKLSPMHSAAKAGNDQALEMMIKVSAAGIFFSKSH